MADDDAIAHWKTIGLFLAILLAGAALGTGVAIAVLALGGAVIRIPGVLPMLDRFLTADFDAPLMWVLLVSSWLLGIVVIYMLARRLLRPHGIGPRS